MPIIKSAKKRVRVARKATIRNSRVKRSLRQALKAFQSTVAGGGKKSAAQLGEVHAKTQSALDKAAKKNIMHKNKIARKKRQLAAQAKAAGLKPTAVKKTTPVKKTAARKAPAKRTAKKAAPAKKPAAKATTKKTAARKPAKK